MPAMPVRKATPTHVANPPTLPRGSACLCCRKRKLKCDATRPVCKQCVKMNRPDECEYDDKKQKSRTQKLREKLAMLEERLKELEADPAVAGSSSSSRSSLSPGPVAASVSDTFPPLHTSWPSIASTSSSSSTLSFQHFPSQSDTSLLNFNLQPSPAYASMSNSEDIDAMQYLEEPFDVLSFPSDLDGPYFPPWDPSQPMPAENTKILLGIFGAHRHQCWYDGDMGRFTDSGNDGQLTKPHPALTNAIYLMACHFGRSSYLSQLEPIFIARIQSEINDALANSSQLVDVVRAQCLLSIYFYAHCRPMEGYRESFSAMRLAVGMGLHQTTVQTYDQHSIPLPVHIPPPQHREELRDRISAFWQVFMLDRCWSVAHSYPIALQDTPPKCRRGAVKTPWPQPPEEEISNEFIESSSIRNIFQETPSELMQPTTHLSVLRIKAAAFYERSFRFASIAHKTDNDIPWADFHIVRASLDRFQESLPPFIGFEAWRMQAPFLDVELFTVLTLTYLADLHLKFDSEPEIGLQATNGVIALIRQLCDEDYAHLDPILSSCWMTVARFYLRVLGGQSLYGMPTSGDMMYTLGAMEQQIIVIETALKQFSAFVPFAGENARKIRQDMNMISAGLP